MTASDAGLQPGAAARRARHLAHVALDLLAGAVALGLGVAALAATGSRPRTAWCTSAAGRSGSGTTPAPDVLAGAVAARPSGPSSSASSTACRWRSRTPRRPTSSTRLEVLAAEPRTTARWRRRRWRGRGRGRPARGRPRSVVPRPSQRSHAPYGELNEKLRGASSSNDRPQCGQARCSAERERLGVASDRPPGARARPRPRPRPGAARSPASR